MDYITYTSWATGGRGEGGNRFHSACAIFWFYVFISLHKMRFFLLLWGERKWLTQILTSWVLQFFPKDSDLLAQRLTERTCDSMVYQRIKIFDYFIGSVFILFLLLYFFPLPFCGCHINARPIHFLPLMRSLPHNDKTNAMWLHLDNMHQLQVNL